MEKKLINLKLDEFLMFINNLQSQSKIFYEPNIEKEFKTFSQEIKISKNIMNLFEEEFKNITNHTFEEDFDKKFKSASLMTKLWKNGQLINFIY